jgi:hypothetical protein
MASSLCTYCFVNYGVRREAEGLAAQPSDAPCPNCLKVGGGLIDNSAAEELLLRFFVRGSIPPEAGGPAPIFQFNSYRQPGEVTFATDLDGDLALLSRLRGVGLFHYGPPLWRIGYTTYYQNLRGDMEDGTSLVGTARKKIWDAIFARCSTKTIEPGKNIFRIRSGQELPPALPEQFDTPPYGLAGKGRYESQQVPIFYGADDVETCLHEARVTLSDWIALGTLTPTRSLRLLNLAAEIDDTLATDPFDSVAILLTKLAFVGSQDYDLCREMAVEIKERGFDGFLFISYFAQAHKRRLRNIALFGSPVDCGKLRLVSVNRVQLTSMSYEYSFGPHNDTSLPIDRHEIDSLTERMRQGRISLIEASDELNRLSNRSSDGPR